MAERFGYLPDHAEKHPVLRHDLGRLTEKEIGEVEKIMALSEAEVLAMLPRKSGVYFVHCANCEKQGQGSSFSWSIDDPDRITCEFCGHSYPSEKYPMTKEVRCKSPSGKTITYPYYDDGKGQRYYFDAGVEFRKKRYFERGCYGLALMYLKTGEERYAERATAIICGLARAFPDFVWKYDLPTLPLKFYDGVPEGGELAPNFRTSRWDWWAYMDIPYQVVQAYDIVLSSKSFDLYLKQHKIDRYKTLERDFFHNACEGVFANPEGYHNMSPTFWRSALIAGRVTGGPDYVHLILQRLKHYLEKQFYFDGYWYEPATSYFCQSSESAFNSVLPLLEGYSDPEGYRCSFDPVRYKNLNPEKDLAGTLGPILKTYEKVRYPDGTLLPMGDTWMFRREESSPPENVALFEQESYLNAAVGHAALCGDRNGGQMQHHLYWTGKHGHYHADTLGISVWANNREIVSDLGYTHSKYKAWARASASHNLVVVDGRNQVAEGKYRSRGNLLYMDRQDCNCQIVDVDGRYANENQPYRRTSFLIKAGEAFYLADFFRAGGGRVYDYFIHGNAVDDCEDTLSFFDGTGNALMPAPARIVVGNEPAGWKPPANEDEFPESNPWYAYGFLREVRSWPMTKAGGCTKITFRAKDKSGFNVFFPADGSAVEEVFTGRNCTCRVVVDNSKLDRNFRQFVALRKTADRVVTFQSVLEPFAAAPGLVKSVRRIDENVLLVEHGAGTDVIFYDVSKPIEIDTGSVSAKLEIGGSYGFVRLKECRAVSYHLVGGWLRQGGMAITTGRVFSQKLRSAGPDNALSFLPVGEGVKTAGRVSDFVLIRHGDDLTHGYFADKIDLERGRAEVEGKVGFVLTKSGSKLTSFPGYELMGDVSASFFPVAYGVTVPAVEKAVEVKGQSR